MLTILWAYLPLSPLDPKPQQWHLLQSGLDIPNANTIFVDDADHYGLSELHQLRGRVGRYKHQAYCYLTVAPHKHLTPEASKRLRAIEEFSQMGAGFAISMRDLEIRGAGNLLGTQQSGHIAAIGYELYCQLLEDAVRVAKNLPPKISAEVDIDLPIEAFLPPEYVPDLRHKIDLYRRIAKIDHADQIAEINNELIDRFGALPSPAERMLKIAGLRLDAALWQIAAITSDSRFIVLHYSDRRRIEQLAKRSPIPVRIVDEKKAYIPIHAKGVGDQRPVGWLDHLSPESFSQPSGQSWLELADIVFTEKPSATVTDSNVRALVTKPETRTDTQTQKPLPPPPKARFKHDKKSSDKPPLASLIRGLTNRSKDRTDES